MEMWQLHCQHHSMNMRINMTKIIHHIMNMRISMTR